jgi:hypothetical protein
MHEKITNNTWSMGKRSYWEKKKARKKKALIEYAENPGADLQQCKQKIDS